MLVAQIPAIVWTADADYRFTSVGGAGLEPLGIKPGALDALPMTDAFGTNDPTFAPIAAHRRALQGEQATYSIVRADRIYHCTVEPLRAGEAIVGSIGIAVDVTELRRAENEALSAYDEAVGCILRAIEHRDKRTGAHVERMSEYCRLIGEELGLSPNECQQIALASRLHDIGKIAVPDGILLKTGQLTPEERKIVERHCIVGHEILAGSGSRILKLAASIALTHQEWFDGSGYPQGLAAEEIPLHGRIAAVADCFDALTSHRPYRAALSFDKAETIMLAESGSHFDPHLLDLFFTSPTLPSLHHDGTEVELPHRSAE